jgi:hypothetical protein
MDKRRDVVPESMRIPRAASSSTTTLRVGHPSDDT